jgi:hypothetical protein
MALIKSGSAKAPLEKSVSGKGPAAKPRVSLSGQIMIGLVLGAASLFKEKTSYV